MLKELEKNRLKKYIYNHFIKYKEVYIILFIVFIFLILILIVTMIIDSIIIALIFSIIGTIVFGVYSNRDIKNEGFSLTYFIIMFIITICLSYIYLYELFIANY